VQLQYQPDEAFASEAFQKYLILNPAAAKTSLPIKSGTQMKTMIEDSDYYLKNFKPSRDSEFSSGGMNGPDLDQMRQLRSNRYQEIPPSDRSNIQIIKIDKRNASRSPIRSVSPPKNRGRSLECSH
jgi:hypothetical protein